MYLDLTHKLTNNLLGYPGAPTPKIKVNTSLKEEQCQTTILTLFSHCGTHVDAPLHMIEEGKSLDQMQVSCFCGNAIVIDVDPIDSFIDIEDLTKYSDDIITCDFVIIRTGWSKYWGHPEYLKDYPCLSPQAAEWIAKQNLKGLGIDTISVDQLDCNKSIIHHILFNKNMIIIENLANLSKIKNRYFRFFCFPLLYPQADGSPIRAVAQLQ